MSSKGYIIESSIDNIDNPLLHKSIIQIMSSNQSEIIYKITLSRSSYGKIERGEKRLPGNIRVTDKSSTSSYFRTIFIAAPTAAIIIIPHPNTFRSSQISHLVYHYHMYILMDGMVRLFAMDGLLEMIKNQRIRMEVRGGGGGGQGGGQGERSDFCG